MKTSTVVLFVTCAVALYFAIAAYGQSKEIIDLIGTLVTFAFAWLAGALYKSLKRAEMDDEEDFLEGIDPDNI